VLIDIDGKHEWRDCIDVPGVRLPRGYYFGTSSVTGDLSGTAPRGSRADSRADFGGLRWVFPSLCPAVEAPLEPMSGLALFLIVFFSLVAIVFAIVIGIIVYNKWQEQSRKHFY
ncbi:LMA2L protein, partial [Ifrita kowaldi]|nr:LMA2L protein [Ifrita kowaldi]